VGPPEQFGLPRNPEAPAVHARVAWISALVTALGAALLCLLLFWGNAQ
jgi:hypothetical protein